MHKRQIAISTAGILSLIILLAVLVFFNPYNLDITLKFNPEQVIGGAIFLILLRALAMVIPAIPSGMVAFAAIPIFGWFVAFICNITGILVGASIAFWLARIYREPLVTRFASLNKINKIGKKITGKKQFAALVAFKLFTVPVVDISSYVVGLTKIGYEKFILATFLAALPTILTFYFGEEVYKRIFGKNFFVAVIAVLIVGSIYFIIKRYRLNLKFKI